VFFFSSSFSHPLNLRVMSIGVPGGVERSARPDLGPAPRLRVAQRLLSRAGRDRGPARVAVPDAGRPDDDRAGPRRGKGRRQAPD
jgi:hypothetical protein